MAIQDLLALNEYAAFTLIGEAATYTPSGGDAVTIRVMPIQPDEVVDFGETRIHATTTVFEVRVSELEDNSITPAAGDTIAYGGSSYLVKGEPERDTRRRLWRVETRPA